MPRLLYLLVGKGMFISIRSNRESKIILRRKLYSEPGVFQGFRGQGLEIENPLRGRKPYKKGLYNSGPRLEIENPLRGRKPRVNNEMLEWYYRLEIENPLRGRKLWSYFHILLILARLEIENPLRGRKPRPGEKYYSIA